MKILVAFVLCLFAFATVASAMPAKKDLWFMPVSAFYMDGFGTAVGIGHQWHNRVSVAGQIMLYDGHGMDSSTGTVPFTHCGKTFDVPVTSPGFNPGNQGFMVTVTIPIQ